MAKPDNLYDILEVSPRAREEVIRAAYNALIKEYHPDRNGDERVARSLNEAKDVLLDRKKRSAYDKDRLDLDGKVVGDYRVLELIAEGGFGKTYKGEHILAKAPVCIKHAHYVSPQDEEILLNEAAAIWDLRHYGIPNMRNIIKLDDGSLALVMSYVPGPTLEQLVTKVGRLDAEHVAWIAERSLNVLKYLHYHGVIHGDVKPQNIIIQPESHTIVLVDYGLSIIRPRADDHAVGFTPYFASPEQKKGSVLIPQSDFYGLGMTMIYALGGDVEKRAVPSKTPDPFCAFIKRMILFDVLARPDWEKEDLAETIQKVRQESFGRKSSNLKPLPSM